MKGRLKKFLSYYKPYKKLFFADMFCAMVGAGITLIFPMITRYITGVILAIEPVNIQLIYQLGFLMLFLVVIEYFCNFYISHDCSF